MVDDVGNLHAAAELDAIARQYGNRTHIILHWLSSSCESAPESGKDEGQVIL
jgi:hypothetical protein